MRFRHATASPKGALRWNHQKKKTVSLKTIAIPMGPKSELTVISNASYALMDSGRIKASWNRKYAKEPLHVRKPESGNEMNPGTNDTKKPVVKTTGFFDLNQKFLESSSLNGMISSGRT